MKALGRDLQFLVGVEGVDEDEVPTARLMRAHESGYLEALEHDSRQRRITNGARAGPMAQDLARAVAISRRRSRHPEREAALRLVLFATAAKPLEIARRKVLEQGAEGGDRPCPPVNRS